MESKKLTYEWLIPFALLFVGLDAFAANQTTLRQVQTVSGNQIHLLFDREIDKSQIKKEYFRDIVQFSLSNTSVYPAKIISVDGSPVSKVFAYQYTPNLVRCRLTVNGKAEDYENRVSVDVDGRSMVIRISDPIVHTDQITHKAAQKTAVENPPAVETTAQQKPSVKDDPETKKILERVLGKDAQNKSEVKSTNSERKKNNSGTGISKLFFWAGGFLGFLLMVAFLYRSVKGARIKNRIANNGRFAGLIGKLTGGKILRKPKMIEVVANHYLGPKKSIAVVKIQGRSLVVGITDENINLITRFEEDFGSDLEGVSEVKEALNTGTGAVSAGAPRFGELLNSELGTSGKSHQISARDQIRKKMEGLKNL